jgi:hypothetical protein
MNDGRLAAGGREGHLLPFLRRLVAITDEFDRGPKMFQSGLAVSARAVASSAASSKACRRTPAAGRSSLHLASNPANTGLAVGIPRSNRRPISRRALARSCRGSNFLPGTRERIGTDHLLADDLPVPATERSRSFVNAAPSMSITPLPPLGFTPRQHRQSLPAFLKSRARRKDETRTPALSQHEVMNVRLYAGSCS